MEFQNYKSIQSLELYFEHLILFPHHYQNNPYSHDEVILASGHEALLLLQDNDLFHLQKIIQRIHNSITKKKFLIKT